MARVQEQISQTNTEKITAFQKDLFGGIVLHFVCAWRGERSVIASTPSICHTMAEVWSAGEIDLHSLRVA